MDVKEAVRAAKQYVQEVFADEGISDVGLEEVEFNDQAEEWRVTIGFSRAWDKQSPFALAPAAARPRSYKVLRISDKTGDIISVRNREPVR
jgi:hypothetical protein